MGYAVYADRKGRPLREAGYGVPAYCDHPSCKKKIDRGMSYQCEGTEERDGEGCYLHFCGKHRDAETGLCERCFNHQPEFEPKDDHPEWYRHVLSDVSWERWLDENPGYREKYGSKP